MFFLDTLDFLGLQVSIAASMTTTKPSNVGTHKARHQQHLDKVTIAASCNRG